MRNESPVPGDGRHGVGDPHPVPASEHVVQFYEEDGPLVEAVVQFVENGLLSGGSGVMIATEKHRDAATQRLCSRGLDVEELREQGRFVSLDAAETMAAFMVDGMPDAGRFEKVIGDVLTKAGLVGRQPRVWAFGEMVALLRADGKPEAALELERLWNDIATRHELSLFCAYPMSSFANGGDAKAFRDVCAEHGRVVPSESYTALRRPDARERLVADLQQKAHALDGETARRRQLEETLRRRDKEVTELLECMQDSVVDIDPDGRVRWGNRAFRELLGYESRECGGLLVVEVLLAPETFVDVLGALLRGQPVRPLPLALRAKDGSTVDAILHASSLRTEGKSLHMRWFVRRTPSPFPDAI